MTVEATPPRTVPTDRASATRGPGGTDPGFRASVDRALVDLFPPRVISVVATDAMWEGRLFPEEADCVRGAVPERRREFTAGRVAARAALARLGVRSYPLVPDEDRVPVWPRGVIGSISHTRDLCAVSVTDRPDVRGLGLDLEEAAPLPRRVVPLVSTPRERERIRGRDVTAPYRVLFSAKEAIYKSWYPPRREPLEFDDVDVSLDPTEGTFYGEIDRPGAGTAHGRFAITGGYVLTAVARRGA